MNIVYLNGDFIPSEQAAISPMDRGFLFGDGVYEVIPSYDGNLVAFEPHIRRLQDGLSRLKIASPLTSTDWLEISKDLLRGNGAGNLGIYLHISRGAHHRRFHAYPDQINPTVFAYTFEIPAAPLADKSLAASVSCVTSEDLRWKHCDIKSSALLGNVMHFQCAYDQNYDEVILFNDKKEITEAAACNVFLVKNDVVATPSLDHQKLPGITRMLVLDIIRRHSNFSVEERVVNLEEAFTADEIWLTSSTKEIAPVVHLNQKAVGGGTIGDVWLNIQSLFCKHRFDY